MPLIRLSRPTQRRTNKMNLQRRALALSAATGLAGLAFFSYAATSFAPGPALTIDVRFTNPISQDIYGIDVQGTETDPGFADFAKEIKLPVLRSGGAAASCYNWEVDASNLGQDNFYLAGGGQATYLPAASVDSFITTSSDIGSKSIVSLPLLQKINSVPGDDLDCSFPVALHPTQQLTVTKTSAKGKVVNAGNGRRRNVQATPLTPVAAQINAIYKDNSLDIQKNFLDYLVTTHGTADTTGVAIYQLDNEPSQWNVAHRDVHPSATGYDELVDSSLLYAEAIKTADPAANVLGPGNPTGAAMGIAGDNAGTHGNVSFSTYYLSQMREQSINLGVRLLDYYAERFFPAQVGGEPIAQATAGNATTQAQRLASTSTLLSVIPNMKSLVNANFPSTKVAISSYNFGGLESINGALAQADVLGIFAREGVDLASLTSAPRSTDPGAFAFRIYRNYDGAGSQFGETFARSTSRDQSRLSVYASVRDSDGALTVVVINKTSSPQSSNLFLNGFKAASRARAFRYSSTNLSQIVRLPDWPMNAGGVTAVYPANSITLIEIPNRQLL